MQYGGDSKLLKFALNDKQIAVAILGQAIIDEGGIGTGITIFYTNKDEAQQLWRIANFLGYANSFKKKKHRNHFHYGFSIKASKRKELYDQIGPLPNSIKDQIFRHLISRRPNINIRARGETRKLIFESLKEKQKLSCSLC